MEIKINDGDELLVKMMTTTILFNIYFYSGGCQAELFGWLSGRIIRVVVRPNYGRSDSLPDQHDFLPITLIIVDICLLERFVLYSIS